MPNRYPPSRTGLLLVDPYNDCLSEGGKLWPQVRAVAEAVDLVGHLKSLADNARRLGITIFYVPHRRWREGAVDGWRHPTPWQLKVDREALFAEGTWSGDWHPDLVPQAGDVVVAEHWGQDGFVGTDLDLQLQNRDIDHIIVAGLMATTCVGATARHGAELGYFVTLVRDATAAASAEAMRLAHEIDAPTFAHNILNTDALLAALATA